MIMTSVVKKVTFLSLFVLMFSAVTGCCVRNPIRYPGDKSPSIVDDIAAETVALVMVDDDGDTGAFCTGVWVSKETILTAAHCALAAARDNAQINENVPVQALGTGVSFIVQSEVTGVFDPPKAKHTGTVTAIDEETDVAIINAGGMVPDHKVAPLAQRVPAVGEPLHFIGHSRGVYWTYMPGVVAGFHSRLRYNTKRGPFVQVTAPIAGGMSGGGAWDAEGRLVGMVSFVSKAPNMGFLIHVDTVRQFLKDNKVIQ